MIKKKQVTPMERALLLVENQCYISALNRIYHPPLATTTLDCIAAKRRLPSSLCATRNEVSLTFAASPLPPGMKLSLFTPPNSNDIVSALQKKLRLITEREYADAYLVKFGKKVRPTERKHPVNQNRPKTSYLPSSVMKSILDQLL
jgi:hypothetical protein